MFCFKLFIFYTFSLKTGEVPPTDLKIEEIFCRTDIKLGTLKNKDSKNKLKKSEEATVFLKKKDMEREVKNINVKIEKG